MFDCSNIQFVNRKSKIVKLPSLLSLTFEIINKINQKNREGRLIASKGHLPYLPYNLITH
jgi:hypothetical protein